MSKDELICDGRVMSERLWLQISEDELVGEARHDTMLPSISSFCSPTSLNHLSPHVRMCGRTTLLPTHIWTRKRSFLEDQNRFRGKNSTTLIGLQEVMSNFNRKMCLNCCWFLHLQNFLEWEWNMRTFHNVAVFLFPEEISLCKEVKRCILRWQMRGRGHWPLIAKK